MAGQIGTTIITFPLIATLTIAIQHTVLNQKGISTVDTSQLDSSVLQLTGRPNRHYYYNLSTYSYTNNSYTAYSVESKRHVNSRYIPVG